MTYSEKLNDPRWQKKRLEIFQRDDWKCRRCKSATKTLHVHHLRYLPNTEPWEYSDKLLISVCNDCHKQAHSNSPKKREVLPWPLEKVGDEKFFGYVTAVGFHPGDGGMLKPSAWACFEYAETETVYTLPPDATLFQALSDGVFHNFQGDLFGEGITEKYWIKKTAKGYQVELP